MFDGHKPHGLSFTEADKLAKKRNLYSRSTLPNQRGYIFDGFAENGWKFNCMIVCGEDGIHRVGGEANYDQIIGWLPKISQKQKI